MLSKAKLFARRLRASLEGFHPYIKDLPIEGCACRFFYGTSQAREWYDPLRPYAKAEYDWVVANVNLKDQKIIDGGAHHGQYTVVFAVASGHTSEIVAVDPVASNCALVEVNLALNAAQARVEACAIGPSDGVVSFAYGSNGRVISAGGLTKPARRLPSIMPDATIVKLDVEGAEFDILPAQIDEMPHVHTWIVEIHPAKGRNPERLIDLFRPRGYDLWWVDRQTNRVAPYPDDAVWTSHTSVFAIRA